jgi:carboxyl-terminal processing protease
LSKRRSYFTGVVTGLILALLLISIILMINVGNLGNSIRVFTLIKAKALEPVQVSQIIDGAMKGMVGELKDPYSIYLQPQEYQALEAHMKGAYGGLGIYVGIPKDTNKLTVMSPIKGTPAAIAGIKTGDEIREIDGKNTSELDIDTAVGMMKGVAGTKVTLGIKRKGKDELWNVKLTREIIEISSVEGQELEQYPRIAYLSISMFNDLTAKEMQEALSNLRSKKKIKGLILDLRNNPGGSLNAAIDTGSYFVPKGKPVVWLVDKNRTDPFPSTGNLIGLPTVILINKGSASASEILAGAIKDVKAGTLVGETSFGKGIVQSVFELKGGAALKITTAKYLTPNKNDIHKKGIAPDVAVPFPEGADPAVIYSGNPQQDIQLKKAVEILQEKMKK